MLEGKHSMESTRDAWTNLKHDFKICQAKSRLVDKLSILQQIKNKKRSNRRQDSMQEKLRQAYQAIPEILAIKTTQLPQRRSLHLSLRGSRSIYHFGALALS